jgi:hypothetical protein
VAGRNEPPSSGALPGVQNLWPDEAYMAAVAVQSHVATQRLLQRACLSHYVCLLIPTGTWEGTSSVQLVLNSMRYVAAKSSTCINPRDRR